MFFIMLNALFVLIVFLLQLNKDMIHVYWPLGVRTNITYDQATQEVWPRVPVTALTKCGTAGIASPKKNYTAPGASAEPVHYHSNVVLFCFFGPFQARIAKELIELRNKSVFAFFMFNALFILIVFLLQLNKDNLHVDWPLGVKTNITHVEETREVVERKETIMHCPVYNLVDGSV